MISRRTILAWLGLAPAGVAMAQCGLPPIVPEHTLLMEGVIRFQRKAWAEMLDAGMFGHYPGRPEWRERLGE
jgi:hypothetical protein